MFENGFRTITDYVIHLWSWNFIHLLPMSQGCALLILGSKGQRSRSWIIDVWKWFPDHNWLCNPPMIMKLHTLAPHESRMCPIDFGVKRSKVKVMAHDYLKMVHRNNGCRFEFVGVGGGPVLLQQYFQYAFICCPYMLPLLFFLISVGHLVRHSNIFCRTFLRKVRLSDRSVEFRQHWVLFFFQIGLELSSSLEYNSRDLSISPMLKLLYLTSFSKVFTLCSSIFSLKMQITGCFK